MNARHPEAAAVSTYNKNPERNPIPPRIKKPRLRLSPLCDGQSGPAAAKGGIAEPAESHEHHRPVWAGKFAGNERRALSDGAH
jgi:hypothetical protein